MESIAIDAPGDNACGMHTNKIRVEAGYDLLTAFGEGLDASVHGPTVLPQNSPPA